MQGRHRTPPLQPREKGEQQVTSDLPLRPSNGLRGCAATRPMSTIDPYPRNLSARP